MDTFQRINTSRAFLMFSKEKDFHTKVRSQRSSLSTSCLIKLACSNLSCSLNSTSTPCLEFTERNIKILIENLFCLKNI